MKQIESKGGGDCWIPGGSNSNMEKLYFEIIGAVLVRKEAEQEGLESLESQQGEEERRKNDGESEEEWPSRKQEEQKQKKWEEEEWEQSE